MPVARKVISNIKNTMTDRSSVEKSVNKMLETYPANILPEMVDGWTTLPEPVKQSMLSINTFYCGLHYIVGLRRIVLQQKGDKILFRWSSGGKTLTWQELREHLIQLISEASMDAQGLTTED